MQVAKVIKGFYQMPGDFTSQGLQQKRAQSKQISFVDNQVIRKTSVLNSI